MNCVFYSFKRALLVCLSVCSLFVSCGSLAEDICAEVKIEILQEFAIERQGFEALMRINNKLDTVSLENINIEVDFADENGMPVTAVSDQSNTEASFYIRVSDMTGVSDIGGNGVIAQSSVAEVRWLIIPTLQAVQGSPFGKLYYVGARLSYTYGGKSQTINVSPDTIVVKPQPEVQLDYFLTEDVVGDNPGTSFVEPAVPYTLGVRVRNFGAGIARNVSIDSAQPRIVENEQGLAIGFKILESYIGNKAAEKTLLLKFGDIPSGTSAVGRWVMETSLSGKFVSFNATTTHAEELGGQLTSLIRETNEHFLEHDVYVDIPGRDDVSDFLVRLNDLESFIYESESTGGDVVASQSCFDCLAVQNINVGTFASSHTRLTISDESLSGFVHIKIEAPSTLAQKLVKRVVRDDGRVISARNSWISQKINPADSANPFYYINILDYYASVHAGSMGYTFNYSDSLENPQTPAIQAILPRITHEGGQVGFLVVASDLDSSQLSLKAESLPVGATFKDQGTNTGLFSWKPILGQAGDYVVTFKASDGVLSDVMAVPIKVNPADDIDGDNLPDSWELEHFGDLSKDADGNPDSDSLSNLEEYQSGTDPVQYSPVIDAPSIVYPVYDQEVPLASLNLVVGNIPVQTGSVPLYHFELYADQSLTSILLNDAVLEQVDNGGATELSLQIALSENTEYFWRVRAQVDDVYSVWQEGKFFINTLNDPPGPPAIAFPSDGMVVDVLKPGFYINNSFDMDRDPVHYSFVLATDTDPEVIVYSNDGVSAGQYGSTGWMPFSVDGIGLAEDAAYIWRVSAEDEHGLSSEPLEARFVVSQSNDAPSLPTNLQPVVGAVLSASEAVLSANASTDAEGGVLFYEFQMDTVSTFDGLNFIKSSAITPAETDPSWSVSNLLDNRTYYWRIRAGDGQTYSAWASGNFEVQIVNTAPSMPVVSNPGDQAWIEILNPLLKVAPSVDLDGDQITYEFQLFLDQNQEYLIIQDSKILNQLQLPDLDNNTWYFWRVRAVDSAGNQSDWSGLSQFFINLDGENDAPALQFTAPMEDAEIVDPMVSIAWIDSDPDSSAMITLLYNGENVIVEGLLEDEGNEANSYDWDVSALEPGQYALSARIQDEDTVVDVACCVLTIPDSPDHVIVTAPVSLQLEESSVTEVEVTVALNRAISAGDSVLLNYSLSDSTEALILNSQNYLLFDDTNWSVPQTIRIKGNDDCVIDGDVSVSLLFDPAISSDPEYAGITTPSISFVTLDNEYPGQTLFICDYTVLQQMQESGNLYRTTLLPTIGNTGDTSWQSVSGALTVADGSLQLVGGVNGSVTVGFSSVLKGQLVAADDAVEIIAPIDAAEYGSDYPKLLWELMPGDAYAVNPSTSNDDVVDGDDNNNYLEGLEGNDTLSGMAGDDILYGGPGSDSLYGGAGNDTFLILGSDYGIDFFDGGDGFDQIVGGYDADIVRMQIFSPTNSVDLIDLGRGRNRIEGTPNADELDFSQTKLLNVILIDGLGGDDIIKGSPSSDVIKGGAGSDVIDGGEGDDIFYFEGPASLPDVVNGGSGMDTISAPSDLEAIILVNAGSNWVGQTEIILSSFDESNSIEVIEGGYASTILSGTDADNTFVFHSFLYSTQINNVSEIRLKGGNDTFVGSLGNDTVSGGSGDDTLKGSDGDDVFLFDGLNQGVDKIYGEGGTDTIQGGVGDDLISFSVFGDDFPNGTASVEIIDGGGGFNTLSGDASDNVLNFSGVTMTSINLIDGQEGDDTIEGSALPDTIRGGAGDDYLDGNDGDDLFLYASGDGVDRYVGGNGYDELQLTPSDDVLELSYFYGGDVVERINGNGGIDAIVGTAGADTLRFSDTELVGIEYIDAKEGDDLVYGSDGADIIYCSAGDDMLYGEAGDDVFICNPAIDGVDRFYGSSGYDTIQLTENDDVFTLNYYTGNYSVDQIDGGAGFNIIVGTSAGDTVDLRNTTLVNIDHIDGKEGNDTLIGSADADIIIGGDGDDTLDGRGGDDVFLIGEGDASCDQYYGSTGTDTIRGTSSDDSICIRYYYGGYSVEAIDGISGNDSIVGTSNGNTLYFDNTVFTNISKISGAGGNDFIRGNAQDNVIAGDQGNDDISGLAGDDTFIHLPGDGRDLLRETGGGTDVLKLGGVSKEDVWLFKSGYSLFVYVINSTDRIEFFNWFYSSSVQIDIIELDSGELLDVSGMQQLSDLMTPYGNPDDAAFTIPSGDQTVIDAAIQAAWN